MGLKSVHRDNCAVKDTHLHSIEAGEFKLLLCCVRSQIDKKRIREIVREGVNWQALLELARQQGVRPLLRQSLKSACWGAVPQKIQLELENFNRANVQKCLFITGELLRVVDVFQKNNVPIATFKGVVLANFVYGDLSLREICDLDVLVHEANVRKAEDLLIDCGYRPAYADREYRFAFLHYQGQYLFRHEQTGMLIDLHWRLSSRGVLFPLHSKDVWSRLGQVTIAGRTVSTLAADDLALFLAAHGTKEGWRFLMWVCDFAEFLRNHQDMDWLAVLDRARLSHSTRPLLLAVLLSSTLLDAPAPRGLLERAMANSAVRKLAEQAQLRMLQTDLEGELEEFLSGLNTYDRLGHRLWPLITLLGTRTAGDYRAMPLPRSWWGLYYLTRPFRLARKLAQRMLHD